MKLLTASQMTELEQLAIKEYGIPGSILMENAARGFCDALENSVGSLRGKNVGIYCGGGNNGGDGFAIARHLSNRGAFVTVGAVFDLKKLKTDAAMNFDIITRMGIPVLSLEEMKPLRFDVIVDALFGTGFHGVPEGIYREAIEAMNQKEGYVAAVDMPSGADSSEGSVAGGCVRADLTVTFGVAKVGQFLYPAKEFVGQVVVVDISLPHSLVRDFPSRYKTLDESLAKQLPKRSENSHKGSFGKVLVLAGSPGMSGACSMATLAVLKTGAGTVTAAVHKGIAELVAMQSREIMTLPLPAEGEQLAKTASGVVLEKLKNQDVLLAGCGLGSSEGAKKTLIAVLSECKKPLVLDADGINLLKGNINIIKNREIPAVLTPHPLEFSRISGHSMEYIKENRLKAATDFAKEFGVVLVLKGADTLVARPDGRVAVCTQSNSGLATAGSGDVLSGVIVSLLAQGMSPGDGAELGVYIHSRAGMLARMKQGAYGMMAGDVLEAVPQVLQELSSR